MVDKLPAKRVNDGNGLKLAQKSKSGANFRKLTAMLR